MRPSPPDEEAKGGWCSYEEFYGRLEPERLERERQEDAERKKVGLPPKYSQPEFPGFLVGPVADEPKQPEGIDWLDAAWQDLKENEIAFQKHAAQIMKQAADHYCLAIQFKGQQKPFYSLVATRYAHENILPKQDDILYRWNFREPHARKLYVLKEDIRAYDWRALIRKETRIIVAVEVGFNEQPEKVKERAAAFLETVKAQGKAYFEFLSTQPMPFEWKLR